MPARRRPQTRERRLERALRAVAAGQQEPELAEELGLSLAGLRRLLVQARRDLAEAEHDLAWLEPAQRTGPQVAQRWLWHRANAHG